jgi:hypothetical protein
VGAHPPVWWSSSPLFGMCVLWMTCRLKAVAIEQLVSDPPSGATKRCPTIAAACLLVCVRLRINVDHGQIIRATLLVRHDCWHVQKSFPVAAGECVLQHTTQGCITIACSRPNMKLPCSIVATLCRSKPHGATDIPHQLAC